jgi:hypothetical protein
MLLLLLLLLPPSTTPGRVRMTRFGQTTYQEQVRRQRKAFHTEAKLTREE